MDKSWNAILLALNTYKQVAIVAILATKWSRILRVVTREICNIHTKVTVKLHLITHAPGGKYKARNESKWRRFFCSFRLKNPATGSFITRVCFSFDESNIVVVGLHTTLYAQRSTIHVYKYIAIDDGGDIEQLSIKLVGLSLWLFSLSHSFLFGVMEKSIKKIDVRL